MAAHPPKFICPLSKSLMSDPVLAEDNFIYDRRNIQAWLNKHGRPCPSPFFPDCSLQTGELRPDKELAAEIRRYIIETRISPLDMSSSSTTQATRHPAHQADTGGPWQTSRSSAASAAPGHGHEPAPPYSEAGHPVPGHPVPGHSVPVATRTHHAPTAYPSAPSASSPYTQPSSKPQSSYVPEKPKSKDPEEVIDRSPTIGATFHQIDGDRALLTVNALQKTSHKQHVHLCLVLDGSSSMRAPVTARDEHDVLIEYNITVMDLTLFAAEVAIHCLQPGDVISVVRFSDQADTIIKPTTITDRNKDSLCATVRRVQANGRTNLWAGISAGLTHLQRGLEGSTSEEHGQDNVYNVCMTLTDGEPNRHPANGYKAAQERFRSQADFDYSLNTLAFGYGRIDSKLLQDLARHGGGTFVNIPDCGMIGTVFTNMLARAKVTTHRALRLVDSGLVLDSSEPVVGMQGYYHEYDGVTQTVELGSLQQEQERSFVVRFPHGIEAWAGGPFKIEAHDMVTGKKTWVTVGFIISEIPDDFMATLAVKTTMAHAAQLMFELFNHMTIRHSDAAMQSLESFLSHHDPREGSIRSHAPAVFADLNGEVRLALDPTSFTRWGHSYLMSLAMAYLHHTRHNFKDKAVQDFGGPAFQRHADMMSSIYDDLPVPQGTLQTGQTLPSGDVINNAAGGCYSSDSRVSLADGTTKACVDVRPGDVLLGGGVVAKVAKFLIQDGQTRFCQLGDGLWITPYHPVWLKEEGGWVFPCHVVKPVMLQRKSMCSFVLEAGSGHHVAVVGGVKTITLGHNIVDDVVLKHDFFGSDKIRARLEELDEAGDGSGVVTFEPSCMVANSKGKIVDVDTSKAVSISAH
eukprot:m.192894 g.192894  ORF g.192894 m.192894 type:complete len:857 (-) comp16969_c0_seq11:123-2693(-)